MPKVLKITYNMGKIIGLLFIIIVIVGGFVGGSYAYDAYLVAPGPDAEEFSFTIEKGTSVRQVSELLEERGIIASARPFRFYLSSNELDGDIQAGDFLLKEGMSYAGAAAVLLRAESKEVEVTIPEGYTAAQIGEAVRAKLPQISEEDWQFTVGKNSPLKFSEALLNQIPAEQGLEGYLFPDTYRFRADANTETVVKTMLQTLERRLAEKGIDTSPETGVQDFDFHEVLTLASIVEREVRSPEEMKNVADIFLKRLKIGMALQADSTVNYVTGGDNPSISLEDTKLNSPYNTYKFTGLTPGPISNPGITAITAVFAPNANPYYFFLTDPEGNVYYGETHEQHLANRKYLR